MENIAVAFVIAGIACAVGLTYLLMKGVPTASLANARVGEVYTFCYLQPKDGTCVRRRVKILDNRALSREEITRLNTKSYRRLDPIFERTGTIVTGESNDGVRNYYAERAKDVRRQLV